MMLKAFSQTRLIVLRSYARPSNPEAFKNKMQPLNTEPETLVPRIEAAVGSPIKNIVVHAGRPDPIALPDDQYPDWMWQLVKGEDASKSQQPIVDRKSLRKANKAKIKSNNALGSNK